MKLRDFFTKGSKWVQIAVTAVGIVGYLVTIYAFYFYENKTALQYDIISNTSVLDINADLGNLEIFYGKSNLKIEKRNLRLISVRVMNTGSTNILKDFYDDEDPLGLQVTDGNIIETPELLEASNDYLKRNVKIFLTSPGTISFSKVIIEPKEFFTVKLLALYRADTTPKIMATGKIAGIRSIRVVNITESRGNRSFFAEVFSGTILVEVVRLFLFPLIAIVLLTAIITSAVGITGLITRIKRKRTIRKFRKRQGKASTELANAVFRRFLKNGQWELEPMSEILSHDIAISNRYKRLLKVIKKEDSILRRPRNHYRSHQKLRLITEMIDGGFVIKREDQLIINEKMRDVLNSFVAFLRAEGYAFRSGADALRWEAAMNSTDAIAVEKAQREGPANDR